MPETPSVYVVDDDQAIADSLERLFASVGIPVLTFSSGEAFLEAYQGDAAGCLVIDMRMPGMSAFDVQKELTARGVMLPIIFVSGYGDVESSVRAMQAGAVDFLEKPFREQAILEKVQKAVAENVEHRAQWALIDDIRADYATLTAREQDVLRCIVGGEPNKRIAFSLGISEKTVEFHRANVMKKMHARSFADLIRKATKVADCPETP